MQRRLVLNWSEAHEGLKRAAEARLMEPSLVGETGKGWTYLTYSPRGTPPSTLLFDVERIRALARENNFALPHEVVAQHNKVVVTAYTGDGRQSSQLFALYRLIQAYCRLYGDSHAHPRHSMYGKLGGIYERPEKGRVWAIYAGGDEAVLEIFESVEKLARSEARDGCRFEVALSNGLSALPRMLHGFDDPAYRRSGAPHYRIVDPAKFHVLIEQALSDYVRYHFE